MVEAPRPVRRALSERVVNSRRVFLGISAIVFAASAAMTIVWCASMSAMGEMQMPGGWAMSMMWMRMPGQTWSGAAASFVGMWVVMMVAMMLPSLTPLLWRYREAIGRRPVRPVGWLTALVGVGYFVVWAVFGMIVFPLGVALAAIVMREPALARAVPIVVGAVVLVAGVLQRSGWKARHLAFCREALGCMPNAAGRRRHCMATWTAPRPSLQSLVRGPDGGRFGSRGHGPSRDGCGGSSHHRGASRTGRRARRARHRRIGVAAGLFLIARATGLR